MKYSDYIVYVDESGDHGLMNINPEFPVFALSFCIVRKEDYIQTIVPQIQRLKFECFGHDQVILREHDIRKHEKIFALWRRYPMLKSGFQNRLSDIIAKSPLTIVASVIMKERLKEAYSSPDSPYNIALAFCMQQTIDYLLANEQQDKIVDIIAESRGKNEDALLELEFYRIATLHQDAKIEFRITFAQKQTNSSGLQLADLTARPIALAYIRPTQTNRAYDVIQKKFPVGGGVRVFPKATHKNKRASGKAQNPDADRDKPQSTCQP